MRDTHGATVIMQGEGNNSKDRTIMKFMYHVPLKVDVAAAHWLLYILLSNNYTN